MRLRSKLVFLATGLTFAIVLVLSVLFLGELLRQRVEQTASANDVLAHQVVRATREAILNVAVEPHAADPDQALREAVTDALRSNDTLSELMNGVIRYSPTVQDVSVTDAHGLTIVSTDPDAIDQPIGYRTPFSSLLGGSLVHQMHQVFGKPRVLDIMLPLERNGMPFLVIHLGVPSTFLRAAYEPWLRAAILFALLAALASVSAAALLSTVALRPLRTIGDQLERLTLVQGEDHADGTAWLLEAPRSGTDPVGRVNVTIDRLDRQMRSREEGYTALQANLNQMLDTLRDGVLLFTADRRAVMVSDAVAHFLALTGGPTDELPAVQAMVGLRLEDIFSPESALGSAVLAAFSGGENVTARNVELEDGRQVQISLDRIADIRSSPGAQLRDLGTLLTLRDTASALELEQELEVSRRLAAIGRLTANVGHEVKNPINAMVVHLELLRGKLAQQPVEQAGAQRHVDILADEMHRLDRVVQTLADFSRPMDLDLREHDLRRVIDQVLDLAGAELKENAVHVVSSSPELPIPVRIDAELLRQALLNLLLNAMQAMPAGGQIDVSVHREGRVAVIEVVDNGPGIPAAVLPRIFDLYFTTKPTGSGIGLAMSSRILQLHGGAMDVRSDGDPTSTRHGTAFTLRLPISLTPPGDTRRPSNRLHNGRFSDAVTEINLKPSPPQPLT